MSSAYLWLLIKVQQANCDLKSRGQESLAEMVTLSNEVMKEVMSNEGGKSELTFQERECQVDSAAGAEAMDLRNGKEVGNSNQTGGVLYRQLEL